MIRITASEAKISDLLKIGADQFREIVDIDRRGDGTIDIIYRRKNGNFETRCYLNESKIWILR